GNRPGPGHHAAHHRSPQRFHPHYKRTGGWRRGDRGVANRGRGARMSARVRVDALLVERGLAESRERAQRLIRAGLVYTSNERLEKPGRMVDREIELNVRGSDCPYVSRGGLKLHGALEQFGHDPTGEVALDIGASTG